MKTPSTHLSLLLAMQNMQESSIRNQAWRDFMAGYLDLIIDWSMRHGASSRQAEDLAQEILVKIIRFLPTYDRAKGKFRTWLGAVIRNHVIETYRRERVAEGDPVGGDSQNELLQQLQAPEATDGLAVSVDTYVDPRLAAAMRSAQDRVDPKTWTVFEQTVIHGRTVADVADEVGITKGAAHMAKRRAMDLVRTACQAFNPSQPSPSAIEPSHESDHRGGP